MKDKIQKVRVVVFGYLTQLPIFLTLWSLTIMPEILKVNFDIQESGQRTKVAGIFYTSFFYGIIIGSLTWPYLLKFISKRNALLYAIILQGILNVVMGGTTSLKAIYIIRFISGTLHNLNTVGKDFIFDFCDDIHGQYAFNFKSCFGLLASFAGPFVGYYIYALTGKSFFLSCLIVSGFYVVGILGFIIFFYWVKDDIKTFKKIPTIADEDELAKLNPKTDDVRKREQHGIKDTLVYISTHKQTVAYIVAYVLANGTFKTMNLISVFFLEAPLEEEGLGITSKELTYITLASYFPCLILLMVSPMLVPKRFSYTFFICGCMLLFSLFIGAYPIIKDIVNTTNFSKLSWLIYTNQFLLLVANPKLFSPFINFLIGKAVPRSMRTSANAITFISSTLCSALLMNAMASVYSFSISDSPGGQWMGGFRKYTAFYILIGLLLICVALLASVRTKN